MADTDADQRIALVTGATGTIGRNIAAALAASGWTIAAVARSSERLRALANELSDDGTRVVGYPCDLFEAEAVVSTVDRISAELGTPAVLVNGAGMIGPLDRFQDCDLDAWTRTIELNVVGSAAMIHACLPAMIRRRWGRIVNIGSASAFTGTYPGSGAYEVSKSALHLLTRYVAASTDGTGVAVVTLHPGEVRSELPRKSNARWSERARRPMAPGSDGSPRLEATRHSSRHRV